MARRKRWARVAIATVLLAQAAALAIALSRTPTTHVVTRVEHTRTTEVLAIPSPPVMVPLPVAAPPSATDTRTCPTPRTDAPSLIPPQLEIEPTGLAVSPTNAGWIAAWNETYVFVSTDAGRTFRRVLDGDGRVHAAQFDCFGHVIVARGARLGIAEGARETWRDIPGLDLGNLDDIGYDDITLIGGGRDVIVLGSSPRRAELGNEGRARVAVSRDLGASWAYYSLSEYSAGGELAAGVQRADGTILVGTVIPDCMSEDLSWIEIAPDGTAKTHWHQIYGVAFQFWGDSILSSYGRRALAAPEDVHWSAYPDEASYGIPIPAPYPVFVTAEKAGRLVGTKLRDYSWTLEGEQMQMDPAGRLWSISCGRLWIARDRASGYCTAPEGV
ncbi:MAG: hypothetical protein AB7T06_36860 [Kofleriaceae bacterium]